MKVDQGMLEAMLRATGRPLRVGGMTFYTRLGKLCCQLSRRERGSGKEWKRTPARERSIERFRAMRQAGYHAREAYRGLRVWEEGARRYAPWMTGENFRERVMGPYYNERGEVEDFANLVVSVGELLLPKTMVMEPVGEGEGAMALEMRRGLKRELKRREKERTARLVKAGVPEAEARRLAREGEMGEGEMGFGGGVGAKAGGGVGSGVCFWAKAKGGSKGGVVVLGKAGNGDGVGTKAGGGGGFWAKAEGGDRGEDGGEGGEAVLARLRWNSRQDGPRARPGDELVVFAVEEGRPGRVARVEGVTARREDGVATFLVPVKFGGRVHLYPFFQREEEGKFSPNWHFRVEEDGKKGGWRGREMRGDEGR